MYQRKTVETPLQTTPPRPLRRLWAGAIAFALFLGLLVVAYTGLGMWEDTYMERLSHSGEGEVVKGMRLTEHAMASKDTLVLFGSSELTFQDDYHAAKVFAAKPTGFGVFVVGSGYRQSIHNFLALTALGKDVRGKRVVFFISPSWFSRTLPEKAFRANFSPQQAYDFAFAPDVSDRLKQRGAKRLLELGAPIIDDPLLHAVLQAEADGDAAGKARYYSMYPLGRLSLGYHRVKEELDLARLIYYKGIKPVHRPEKPGTIDWDNLQAQATAEAREKGAGNPFGIHKDYYAKFVEPKLSELKDSTKDETWLVSSEYDDLQLVLDAIGELKVDPLFISLPVMGSYYDFKGHAAADRQAYYAKVRRQIEAAGYPVVDFGSKEYEPGWMRDPWHPGWKGAIAIDQVLDDFYHGRGASATH